VNFAPQKPKIGRIGYRAGHAHWDVNVTKEMRRCKLHARDAPFTRIGMCGCTSVPFTDILVDIIVISYQSVWVVFVSDVNSVN